MIKSDIQNKLQLYAILFLYDCAKISRLFILRSELARCHKVVISHQWALSGSSNALKRHISKHTFSFFFTLRNVASTRIKSRSLYSSTTYASRTYDARHIWVTRYCVGICYIHMLHTLYTQHIHTHMLYDTKRFFGNSGRNAPLLVT